MSIKAFGVARNRQGDVAPGAVIRFYQDGVLIATATASTYGKWEASLDAGTYDILDQDGDWLYGATFGAPVEITDEYSEANHSHQTFAADLDAGAGVGGVGTNPKFIAPFMGNILGDLLTKAGAYLAGVIGMFSITGARSTDYPCGGVVGMIADGVTDCDGPVVSVIDGSDPSAQTNCLAMFKARMENNHASSGAEYGVDLHHAGNANFTGGPVALKITKATIRSAKEVCWLEKAGVPGAGDGAAFAEKGSLCTDITNGDLYINAGTKATPAWKLVTRAA